MIRSQKQERVEMGGGQTREYLTNSSMLKAQATPAHGCTFVEVNGTVLQSLNGEIGWKGKGVRGLPGEGGGRGGGGGGGGGVLRSWSSRTGGTVFTAPLIRCPAVLSCLVLSCPVVMSSSLLSYLSCTGLEKVRLRWIPGGYGSPLTVDPSRLYIQTRAGFPLPFFGQAQSRSLAFALFCLLPHTVA